MIWDYHNRQMIKLKEIYQKTSRQTQNRIQEVFDSIDYAFDYLYNIADDRAKKRINTYIEEWQDKGLLKGQFGLLARNIYKRTRVKNSEILELLIYEAYIEEQSKIEEQEQQIMKEDVNYYYEQGQEEVNQTLSKKRRKLVSVIPDAIFLALLTQPNSKGYVWNEYQEVIIKYNADQIYRQLTIDLQQQKEPDITNDIYQRIIRKQQNSKLNINGDKISGDIDNQLIGMNNYAKIEGIKAIEPNAKYRFIAIEDDKTTPMCHSLDGQIFNLNDWNEFNRYYGETANELQIEKIRCKGAVIGLNMPPVAHHFHWCRSTITYQMPEDNIKELDIPNINKDISKILKKIKINRRVQKLFNKYLTDENVKIDNKSKKVMYYDTDEDKIIINLNHPNMKYYDINESLTHEIIHLIDYRNKIYDKIDLDNELRRAYLSIDREKYISLFKEEKHEVNMFLGDILSAVTEGEVKNLFGHERNYWLKDVRLKKMELSANIMSAYLNKDQETLQILEKDRILNKIKEKVISEYDKFTR